MGRKKNTIVWGSGILLALALILTLSVSLGSNQAIASIPIDIAFQGEYSLGGSEWAPIDQTEKLSALDGDLILRGTFDLEIQDGIIVTFYCDHILPSIEVDGNLVYEDDALVHGLTSSHCSRSWLMVTMPYVGPDSLVTIRLHNPHRLGNAAAYTEFLDSLCISRPETLENVLRKQSMLPFIAGLVILILALGIIGIAIAYSSRGVHFAGRLWTFGLMSLFAGGYILLNNPYIPYLGFPNAVTTYTQQLCLMLGILMLDILAAPNMEGRINKGMFWTIAAEGILDAGILLACLSGVAVIYDTLPVWVVGQMVLRLALVASCVYDRSKASRLWLPCALYSAVLLLELLNLRLDWWTEGTPAKTAFIILFVVCFVTVVFQLPKSYQAAVRAKELEQDLKNARVTLATSQIRTHFIFNLLNAVSGMCKYDPEEADRTIVRFSRYLRANIDVLQDDRPVPFQSAYQNLVDYVVLEQIRFGDRIQFSPEIEVWDFKIPSLILQPITENAIKHGLMPKPGGGTIKIRTLEETDRILIYISDDGVGFDPADLESKGAVGLSNVRFRLQYMVGGQLQIESAPGQGTTVTISIPKGVDK